MVTDAAGKRVILRWYRERPEPHTALARLRRERWVLETLLAAGAPVAEVLATCEEAGAEALLLEFAPGELLGSLVARMPARDAAPVWCAAGRALARAHAVDNARAASSGCESAGIRAPAASRGPYHYDEACEHLAKLGSSRPGLAPLEPLRAIIELALPLYERAPLVLCQYDAHLWQFVLARSEADWACTAILDWEDADLDDPDWDLAQLDVFRFETIGATPEAFFAGYVRTPTSPLYTLYRLERAAWTLDAYVQGAEWLALSVPPAERLLHAVLDRPQGLRERVEKAVAALG